MSEKVTQNNEAMGPGKVKEEESSESNSSLEFNDLPPEENLVLKILQENFNEVQMQRYESFKVSKFELNKIKKIVNSVLGNVQVNELNLHIIKTAAKVYLGDLVETALEVQGQARKSDYKHRSPLETKHLREAFRILQENNNGNFSKGSLSGAFI